MSLDPVVEQLRDILPDLTSINYTTARTFVSDMAVYRERTNLGSFWSLCSVIWNSESIESQKESISKWLLQSAIDSLPSQIDSFLYALFTHNIKELENQGQHIDPKFPLILASPPPEVGLKIPSPPDFLRTRRFQFGKALMDQLYGFFYVVLLKKFLNMLPIGVFYLLFIYGIVFRLRTFVLVLLHLIPLISISQMKFFKIPSILF